MFWLVGGWLSIVVSGVVSMWLVVLVIGRDVVVVSGVNVLVNCCCVVLKLNRCFMMNGLGVLV